MMERQLALGFARYELPPYRVSWREGAVTRIVEVGARCHDERWPWWHPHDLTYQTPGPSESA